MNVALVSVTVGTFPQVSSEWCSHCGCRDQVPVSLAVARPLRHGSHSSVPSLPGTLLYLSFLPPVQNFIISPKLYPILNSQTNVNERLLKNGAKQTEKSGLSGALHFETHHHRHPFCCLDPFLSLCCSLPRSAYQVALCASRSSARLDLLIVLAELFLLTTILNTTKIKTQQSFSPQHRCTTLALPHAAGGFAHSLESGAPRQPAAAGTRPPNSRVCVGTILTALLSLALADC